MILPLIILCTVGAVWGKQLDSKPQMHISVEVGQAYTQNIPILFKRFQHSTLTNIKRDTIFYESPVCEIRPASPALLRQVTHLQHNTNRTFQQDEIVYKFEELSALRVFIDAIYYQQSFIVLYKLNEMVIYSFSQEKGYMESKQIIQIPGEDIQQGQFAINQGTILLFMLKRVIRIDKDSFKVVEGYKQITGTIDDIQSVDQYIYIAAGNEGVITYKYDNNSHTLSLIANAKIYDQTGSSNTSFDANRLHIDTVSRIAYILDRQQGVVSASLDKMHSGGQVKGNDFRVLMGGCENMVVSPSSIYLTCPELVKLNKQSGAAEKVSRNSFYAYEMELSGRRLFLYGHQEIAVYDIMGNIAQQFSLDQIVQKSFLIGDYLVTFSNKAVSSYMLISQQEELHCYTASSDRKGVYHGRFVTTGLCSQYFQAPQNNTDFCQVDYPFTLKIQDSAFDDYKIEIIVVLVWIVLSGIIALALFIRQHMIHKSYKELVEQQSRESIEFVPKVEMQKRRQEEVVE